MTQSVKADMQYFAVYDSKANTYRDPILAMSEWDVLRDYERLCRDEKGQSDVIVTNAEDFQLFSIGEYHRQTGNMVGWTPRHIASFHQVKASVLKVSVDTARLGVAN